jgi:3-oxoacyl-[acyl-carrier-protein] synthase II
MRSVAITGLGLVTPLGLDAGTSWAGLLAGRHAVAPISRFDASAYGCTLAAEVSWDGSHGGPELGTPGAADAMLRRGSRFFLRAAREAWADARLSSSRPPARVGVAAGVSVNYLHLGLLREYWRRRDARTGRLDLARVADEGVQPASAFLRGQGDSVPAAIARALGLEGPQFAVDTACASSLHAIMGAARLVARGEATAMVAGGGCATIVPLGILAFSRIGALTASRDPDRASRPFDRRRDGFVPGEGAGAVVLEDAGAARARGARIHAVIAGAGSSTSTGSLTDPSPGGLAEAAAMRLALEEAAADPGEIDYVAAHGTGTPKNDLTETLAIERVFGARAPRLLVSSNKGHIGHTLAAAGVINVVAAAQALAHQVAPPTVGCLEPDPECGLDYVRWQPRPARLRAALVNAFAFGGQNACLCLRAVQGRGAP